MAGRPVELCSVRQGVYSFLDFELQLQLEHPRLGLLFAASMARFPGFRLSALRFGEERLPSERLESALPALGRRARDSEPVGGEGAPPSLPEKLKCRFSHVVIVSRECSPRNENGPETFVSGPTIGVRFKRCRGSFAFGVRYRRSTRSLAQNKRYARFCTDSIHCDPGFLPLSIRKMPKNRA